MTIPLSQKFFVLSTGHLVFRATHAGADNSPCAEGASRTTVDEPGHLALALIIECGDDLARIVIPASVWSSERRGLLAVDRPVAVTGESDVDPFGQGTRAVATSLRLLDSHH